LVFCAFDEIVEVDAQVAVFDLLKRPPSGLFAIDAE
jgi:hypothetical protein